MFSVSKALLWPVYQPPLPPRTMLRPEAMAGAGQCRHTGGSTEGLATSRGHQYGGCAIYESPVKRSGTLLSIYFPFSIYLICASVPVDHCAQWIKGRLKNYIEENQTI